VALRADRAEPHGLPVIAVTGFADDDDVAGASFARVLRKPIDPWRLCTEICEVLGQRPPGGMTSSLGRILVVDDDPQVGATLRDGLVEFGYVVKMAVRGTEALQIVPMFQPDAVLLDLQMPGMSGIEVLARIVAAAVLLPPGEPAHRSDHTAT
jgi:CheY-like chemotaxis protein